MSTELRPLTLGEILDRTAELYRNHFLLFAGIAAIFAGVMLLMQSLHLGAMVLLGYPAMTARQAIGSAGTSVIEGLAILILAGMSIAAISRAVAWVYLGERATVRGAVVSTRPRLWRYLWLMTMAGFRAWAPLAALYVILFAILFMVMPAGFLTNPAAVQAAPARNPAGLVAAGVGILILAPLILGGVVYGVWMSLRYSLGMPACVVEDTKASAALKRSVDLSTGSRGRIFVLGLLVYAVKLLLGILFGFPFIAFGFKHPGQQLPLGYLAIQQVGTFLVNTFIGPIYAIGLTLFYYDQRVRKEGFDVEWMMQAAGLTPESAPPQSGLAQVEQI